MRGPPAARFARAPPALSVQIRNLYPQTLRSLLNKHRDAHKNVYTIVFILSYVRCLGILVSITAHGATVKNHHAREPERGCGACFRVTAPPAHYISILYSLYRNVNDNWWVGRAILVVHHACVDAQRRTAPRHTVVVMNVAANPELCLPRGDDGTVIVVRTLVTQHDVAPNRDRCDTRT